MQNQCTCAADNQHDRPQRNKADADAHVVRDRGGLENVLRFPVQPFALGDRLRKRENLQKVVDALHATVLVLDHSGNQRVEIRHAIRPFPASPAGLPVSFGALRRKIFLPQHRIDQRVVHRAVKDRRRAAQRALVAEAALLDDAAGAVVEFKMPD